MREGARGVGEVERGGGEACGWGEGWMEVWRGADCVKWEAGTGKPAGGVRPVEWRSWVWQGEPEPFRNTGRGGGVRVFRQCFR